MPLTIVQATSSLAAGARLIGIRKQHCFGSLKILLLRQVAATAYSENRHLALVSADQL